MEGQTSLGLPLVKAQSEEQAIHLINQAGPKVIELDFEEGGESLSRLLSSANSQSKSLLFKPQETYQAVNYDSLVIGLSLKHSSWKQAFVYYDFDITPKERHDIHKNYARSSINQLIPGEGPAHCAKWHFNIFDITKSIILLNKERFVSVDSHDSSKNVSSDILWISGSDGSNKERIYLSIEHALNDHSKWILQLKKSKEALPDELLYEVIGDESLVMASVNTSTFKDLIQS